MATNVILMTMDGGMLTVNKKVVKISETINSLIKDLEETGMSDEQMSVPVNVEMKELNKIVSFCQYYHDHPDLNVDSFSTKEGINISDPFCAELCGSNDGSEIDDQCKLARDADYLCIQPLRKLMVIKIASMLRGKTPDEIRKILKIKETPKNAVAPQQ